MAPKKSTVRSAPRLAISLRFIATPLIDAALVLLAIQRNFRGNLSEQSRVKVFERIKRFRCAQRRL